MVHTVVSLLGVYALYVKVAGEVEGHGKAKLHRDDILTGHSEGGRLRVPRTGERPLRLIENTPATGYCAWGEKGEKRARML